MRTLLITCLLLAGCGTPRSWYIQEPKDRPTAPLGAVGHLTFSTIKQQDDYVRIVFIVHNDGTAPLRFKPIDATTTAWGFDLLPMDHQAMVRREGGYCEAGFLVPPGTDRAYEVLWVLDAAAKTNDWKWCITVDGLCAGDQVQPQIVIPMPAYIEHPYEEPRGR